MTTEQEIHAIADQISPLSPAPWDLNEHRDVLFDANGSPIAIKAAFSGADGDMALLAAAPALLAACEALEAAEDANANCTECEGLGVPELCPACFPLFDDARLKRRAAIARAEGVTEPDGSQWISVTAFNEVLAILKAAAEDDVVQWHDGSLLKAAREAIAKAEGRR